MEDLGANTNTMESRTGQSYRAAPADTSAGHAQPKARRVRVWGSCALAMVVIGTLVGVAITTELDLMHEEREPRYQYEAEVGGTVKVHDPSPAPGQPTALPIRLPEISRKAAPSAQSSSATEGRARRPRPPDLDNQCAPTARKAWAPPRDKNFRLKMSDCTRKHLKADQDVLADCIREDDSTDVTHNCSRCFARSIRCGMRHCMRQCVRNRENPACVCCIKDKCAPVLERCTGMPKSDLPAETELVQAVKCDDCEKWPVACLSA